MSGKSSYIIFSLGKMQMPVAKMYLSPTRDDGFCFGYAEKDFPKVHLTVFIKDGKVRAHIKDETEIDESRQYPWGQQISLELVDQKLNRIVRKWIDISSPQSTCYVMQPSLLGKAERIAPNTKDSRSLIIPLEFLFGEILLDFKNRDRWRKTRLVDLRKTRPYYGYVLSKNGTPKVVMPYENDRFISFSDRQQKRLWREHGTILGFDMFFDYLWLKYGDQIRVIERQRVSELENLLRSSDDFSG